MNEQAFFNNLILGWFILALVVFVALLFAQMGAVDVAFVEASLGAGITGVFFVIALFLTRRRSED